MTAYLIKSTFSLALLYAAYYILFSRIKSFRLNRYILLISVSISLLFPLISISFDASAGSQALIPSGFIRTVSDLNRANQQSPMMVSKAAAPDFTISLQSILVIIYFTVTFFLMVRFIKNLYRLLRRVIKCERVEFHNSSIVLQDEDIVPYSFFNSIFISRKDFESGSIDRCLIDHEAAHIKQRHSIDIIFIELIEISYWFNPLIYMFRKAIKLNHEYLADEFASENDTTISEYSYKLIDFSSGRKTLPLTSGLNYSLIKKRIGMLLTQKSSKYLKIRFSVMVIIVAGLFLFTACVFNTGSNNVISNSVKSNRTPDPINTTSGTSSLYRINDSTYYVYGDFTVISGSEKTKIKAHKIKLAIEFSNRKNYFENDFLSGKVYTDGVDVYTNKLYLDKIISYKADHIEGSTRSNVIRLRGNAEVKGEDLKIQSGEITLYLSEWKLR